jgi:pyruvate formate lyase activating enzyme
VTFSGGEPLMQPEFLEALLRSCRKGHIHTCLDTCGQAPWDVLERMIPLVDIFLYDLKSVSSALHARETGLSNELILRNLRRLAGKGRAIVIRIPLIPGINDAPEEIDAMGEFIKRLEGVRDVSLLPFHDIAGEKYRRLGTPSPLADLKPQPQKRVEEIKGRMESFGFNVKIGS